MDSTIESTSNLSDLTFDVEPRREWTPPNAESPAAGFLPSDLRPHRSLASTPSVSRSRSPQPIKLPPRPSTTDVRANDIRRANLPRSAPLPLNSFNTHLQPQPRSPSPTAPCPPDLPPSQPPSPSITPSPSPAPTHSNTTAPGAEEGRSNPSARRANLGPVRIVCPEPSFSQPSFSELPTIRGQPVAPISPSLQAGIGAGVGVGVATVSNTFGSMGAAAASGGGGSRGGRGSAGVMTDGLRHLSSPDGAAEGFVGNSSGGGGGGSTSPGVPPLMEHRTPHSFHTSSSCPSQDTVDHYLTRFLIHRVIKNEFRTKQDDHIRTVTELGVKIQAMTRPGSAGALPEATHARGGGEGRGRGGITGTGGGGTATTAAATTAGSPPTSPSAATRGTPAPSGRTLLRTGLTSDGGELWGGDLGGAASANMTAATTAALPLTHGSCPASPHPQEGAYLALPDGSFAGSPPLRSVPKTEGLLFERYSRQSLSQAAELPELQLRYLRPGVPVPKEPRPLRRMPRKVAPAARALPNGIPTSRLERLSARRRERSPPRAYQKHLFLHKHLNPPELLRFNGTPLGQRSSSANPFSSPIETISGAAIAAASANLTAVGDGLLRSPALNSSLPNHLFGPGSDGGGGAGSLAQYLRVGTSPRSGEPLLDESFYSVLQQHFRTTLHSQTAGMRAQLNVNLPLVLGALNCINVTETPVRPLMPPPPPLPLSGGAAATDGVGLNDGGFGQLKGSRRR